MKHLYLGMVALVTAGCVTQVEEVNAPACSAQAGEASQVDPMHFGGTWEGQGCQSDGPCWSILAVIVADEEGRPTGAISYPSEGCTGRLQFVQWEPGDVAVFRERFDKPGRCVPNGWLRLQLVDTKTMNFVWAHPDGRVDAGTTLQRSNRTVIR